VAHDQNSGADNPLGRMDAGFRFQKNDRLLKRSEFRRLYKSGRLVKDRFFTIRYCVRSPKEPVATPRLGITVSRRVGNAVVRNRIKRIVREFFRSKRNLLPESADLNIIAQSDTAGQPGHLLTAALQTLFENIKTCEDD